MRRKKRRKREGRGREKEEKGRKGKTEIRGVEGGGLDRSRFS